MENTLIPFTKLITVNGSTESGDIELKDTSGNLIDCNYCHVAPEHNPVSNGHFFVYPEISYFSGTVTPSGTGSPLTDEGAGGAGTSQGKSVELFVPAGRTFNKIKIKNGFALAANFIVTYGVARPYTATGAASLKESGR